MDFLLLCFRGIDPLPESLIVSSFNKEKYGLFCLDNDYIMKYIVQHTKQNLVWPSICILLNIPTTSSCVLSGTPSSSMTNISSLFLNNTSYLVIKITDYNVIFTYIFHNKYCTLQHIYLFISFTIITDHYVIIIYLFLWSTEHYIIILYYSSSPNILIHS